MSRKMLFYIGLVLIVTNLFYHEILGLNALLVSVIYVVVAALNKNHSAEEIRPLDFHWFFAAFLFIFNGFAVFYTYSTLSQVLYFFTFFYFSAVHNELKISFPLALAQSVQSFCTGFYRNIENAVDTLKRSENKRSNLLYVRILMVSIPLIIAIIFLKLYQSADETFYRWTKFINLDWISWGFIFSYILFFILLFGFFFFKKDKTISQFENSLKNAISKDYSDKIQVFMGVANEQRIALSLLITLNLMLLLYNFIDLRFIFIELPNPSPNLRYSDLLHGGVNSLIASIVLVIIIITFIYRGQLNFQGSKLSRSLAIVWIFQNTIMVTTTVVKNYEYISHWGLTYKRIGVYIYLLLAAAGLIFTLIKIIQIKSIWFLVRNTTLAFVACFTLVGAVNWNKLIADYNLTALRADQIDFEYLHSLGEDTYPQLINYYSINHNHTLVKDDYEFWHELFYSFDMTRERLQNKADFRSWRSLNIREMKLLNEMKRYKLEYTNKYHLRSSL